MEARYVPGRRNIGPAEVRRRYHFGLGGLAAACLAFVVLYGIDAPRVAGWLLALPLFVAALGFVEATGET
jgi:hypothetical protein